MIEFTAVYDGRQMIKKASATTEAEATTEKSDARATAWQQQIAELESGEPDV